MEDGGGGTGSACVCVAKLGRDLLVCLGLRWLGDLTCRTMEREHEGDTEDTS